MSEDKRSERSDRLKKRLEKDKGKKKDKKGETIKERPSVLMYIPEELYRRLDIRFDELNLQHKKETGNSLQKNKDFYPAVIKAGLEGKKVEDILDI